MLCRNIFLVDRRAVDGYFYSGDAHSYSGSERWRKNLSAEKKRGKLGRGIRAARTARGAERADLWNYATAARYIGIAEKTLQEWIQRDRHSVPHVRLGRFVKFQRAALDSWLARGGTQLAPTAVTEELEAR